MDIFNTDHDLDVDKANAAIRAAAGMSHGHTARTGDLDVIRTAALVSIADSLRTLAVESAIAMGAAGHLNREFAAAKADDHAAFEASVAVVDAPEGAMVTLHDGRRGRLTGDSGVSEGSAWVELTAYNESMQMDTGNVHRVWADQVASIVPPNESGSMAELAAEVADLHAEVFDDVTPPDEPEVEVDVPLSDVTDDIDADFDGDAHPAAEDAVAELKARRKAAKKGK